MDLSKLSNEDLLALQSGDLSKVSDAGLTALRGGQNVSAQAAPAPKEERSTLSNIGAGVASGFADVGDTLLNAAAYLPGKVLPGVKEWNDERSASLRDFNKEREDSTAFNLARIGSNVAATMPVGGVLGAGVKALSQSPKALALARAFETGGFKAGTTPGVANMATRMTGGAVTGGVSAALVNPEDASTGAAVGAALPPTLKMGGKLGSAIGRTITGPEVPAAVQQGAQAARAAGYVIPPSQVKPTLLNRALEGFSGKIATAQNASAKNQDITNELAKKAIGADELSQAALAKVRESANQAYDALGNVGAFQTDEAFHAALDKAGASTAELRKNFPELVNNELDDLIVGLKSRPEFDAQPTIEAIKQFRANASANKASTDPAKVALGRAQNRISSALEDLIDRNLQKADAQDLLQNYRAARQTLAKVYDVEKAMNKGSGNIDAQKLARALEKGRPLTGELRQIAEFSAQFPKATQTVEKMGSLPQVSPLDFGALGTISAATSNPALMAGVLARPAARAAVLSGPVQNRMVKPASKNALLAKILENPDLEQLLYRAGPVLATDQ